MKEKALFTVLGRLLVSAESINRMRANTTGRKRKNIEKEYIEYFYIVYRIFLLYGKTFHLMVYVESDHVFYIAKEGELLIELDRRPFPAIPCLVCERAKAIKAWLICSQPRCLQ